MSPETIIDIFRNTIFMVMLLTSAIIIPGLIIGLIVSIFQAATQINEQTLSFIPKLLITFTSLMFFAPWIINKLINFSRSIIQNVIYYIG